MLSYLCPPPPVLCGASAAVVAWLTKCVRPICVDRRECVCRSRFALALNWYEVLFSPFSTEVIGGSREKSKYHLWNVGGPPSSGKNVDTVLDPAAPRRRRPLHNFPRLGVLVCVLLLIASTALTARSMIIRVCVLLVSAGVAPRKYQTCCGHSLWVTHGQLSCLQYGSALSYKLYGATKHHIRTRQIRT